MDNTCFKTSNNKYYDCPALMSDGRAFTDYRPSNYVNDLIRINNKVYDSYQYRQFLINNAENIINDNNKYNVLKNGCNQCEYNVIPNETKCVYNKKYGLCVPNSCDGLGLTNYASTKNLEYSLLPGKQDNAPFPNIATGKNINKN